MISIWLFLIVLHHFYKSEFLFFLILVMTILFIISLVSTIYTKMTLVIDEKHVNMEYHKDNDIHFIFSVRSKWIFPRITIAGTIENLHTHFKEELNVSMYYSKEKCEISHRFVSIGTYQILFKEVIIHDYFNFIKLKKKVPYQFEMNVYPIPKKVTRRDLIEEIKHNEGETIDERGIDYTELFGLHEYQEGEDFKHIHPILSAKYDKYIVKEGSDSQMKLYYYPLKKYASFNELIPHLNKIYQLFLVVVVERNQYFFVKMVDKNGERDIPVYSHYELYSLFDDLYKEYLV